MNFLKALGSFLSSTLLKLSLYGFSLAFAFVSVFGAPDNVKQSLQQSNLYHTAVDGVLDASDQTPETEASNNTEQLPLDDPEIRQAAKAAFTPETLERWAGHFVDSTYGWLEGKTNKPEFMIDTTTQRQAFVSNVVDAEIKRVEGLRPCSREETMQLARQTNIDIFNLQCRPPINIASEKQRFINEVENNAKDFLGDNVIDSTDLVQSGQGPNPFTNSPAPTVFQWAKRLPLMTIIVGFVSILLLVWLARDKFAALTKVGRMFIGIGLFLLVSTLLFNYLFNRANQPGGALKDIPGMETGSLQSSLVEVVKSLFSTFNMKIILIAVIYLLIGIGVLLTLRFKQRTAS